MTNPIRPKRSITAGAVPSGMQLQTGELAVNAVDGKLFVKKTDNTVVQIGASSGGAGTGWTNPGNISVGDIVFASPLDTILFSDLAPGASQSFTGSTVVNFSQVSLPSNFQLRTGIEYLGNHILIASGSQPLAVSSPSMFFSYDGGFNWETVRLPTSQVWSRLAANSGSFMLISGTTGVSTAYGSQNYGSIILPITLPSFPAIDVTMLDPVSLSQPRVLYIPNNTTGASGIIYRSDSLGVLGTFSQVQTSVNAQLASIDSNGQTVMCIKGQNGGTTAFNTQFPRSVDGGNTWNTITVPAPSSTGGFWRYINHVGTNWFITPNLNDGTFLRSSDDGATWTLINSSINCAFEYIRGIGTSYFATGPTAFSTDAGLTWQTSLVPSGSGALGATDNTICYLPYEITSNFPYSGTKALTQNLYVNGVKCTNGTYKLLGGSNIGTDNGLWVRTA